MTKVIYKNEELIKLAQEGDTYAEEKLLLANDKLCYYIARRYTNTGIEIDDLASLARIGLFKAYKKFDLSKNIKFATFATRVMNNEILMEIRRNKKHGFTINLEHSINTDVDGNELTIMDIIPAPEDKVSFEDSLLAEEVLNIFCNNAKERDIAILKRCIMGEETQKDVADDFGISQSYVARIIDAIGRALKHIAKFGTYKRMNANIKKKEVKTMKKAKRYTKMDYIYAFRNYPDLSNKEIGVIMNVVPQSVVNYRSELKSGKYDDVELTDVSKDLMAKLETYAKDKTEKIKKKTALKISDEIVINSPEVKEFISMEIGPERAKKVEEISKSIDEFTLKVKDFKKEKISNDENIILNNNISIMSNIKEVSNLILGIHQLLENSPENSKVKLDLKFEVIK